MFNRSALILLTLVFLLPTALFAKPKTKVFNNAPDEVFQAALKTARERHVVTFTDEKNLMITFETGVSAWSYGFVANASVEAAGNNQAKLIINVQQKQAAYSFNAGDRMADKFFQQVQEELANASTQRIAQKTESPHVDVPPTAADPRGDTSDKGSVSVTSNPDGADVLVDGVFVGNAPAVLKLSPGKHTISVTQNGHQAWTRELFVMAGAEVTLNAISTK
ncbi:MAG TPA: PEGA domain-containing protein [Pseudacidobacterium sp.]|jgi:archaellum component FlaF (FlaF/FlaG flagellin family)|nr:PEGA domain-containing protein [Pseudacidobacterium sp.]